MSCLRRQQKDILLNPHLLIFVEGSGEGSSGDSNKQVVWLVYDGKEAKIREPRNRCEDVADLRDEIFTKFKFSQGVLASELRLWCGAARLNIHADLADVLHHGATITVTHGEQG